MRALEAFHESEQIRLALRQTLQTQREIENADRLALVPSRTSTPRSKRSVESEQVDDDESLLGNGDPNLAKTKYLENQALILNLPDAIVLDDIIGNYLDFDTIFLILPQLSKDWMKAIWGQDSGAALWKKLCTRAWAPLHLPMKKLAVGDANDWQMRFSRRPRIRLSGPYVTYSVFIQYPGPRNMWTPKDAPTIKVVYHYRFWWFREDNRVLYIALATQNPSKIIEMMRKELIQPGTGSNTPEIVFWKGTYSISREDGRMLCEVDVPHARHGVRFRFELCPGGSALRVLSHLSYRFKTPLDFMNHQLPEYEEDRYFKYRPGFL